MLILANIILTEFEKQIVEDLINAGTIKFYRRYVDDTLVLIKPCDIPSVLKKFNSFDKNLTLPWINLRMEKCTFYRHLPNLSSFTKQKRSQI